MTLNLTQRSFKVIHFGGNQKPVYDDYRPLIYLVAFAPSSTVLQILQVLCAQSQFCPYPTPIPAKIWECSLWNISVMLGSVGPREQKGLG